MNCFRGIGSPARCLWPRPREQRAEQFLRPLKTFVRQDQGLRLVHRVCNQPLPMQTIRHIPIEALPGASFIVQRQPKQRQDRIIDLVRVDLHRPV